MTASTKTCPVHGARLRRRTSRHGPYWICPVDGCDILCGNTPHSTPADSRTRRARRIAHDHFDVLWRGKGPLARKKAYRWLQDVLSLPSQQCHIGLFGIARCHMVIKASKHRMQKQAEEARRVAI